MIMVKDKLIMAKEFLMHMDQLHTQSMNYVALQLLIIKYK